MVKFINDPSLIILEDIMKCEECGKEVDGTTCKNCGAVYDIRPIALNYDGYPAKKSDITTLYASEMWSWEHPLSPKIRKTSKAFNPKYQKKYEDYVYIKAYESISKLCANLKLPKNIKNEALNLFRGIRTKDPYFFKRMKLAPTYLACIKIACRLNDYPILNHDLAVVIDYKLNKDSKNLAYMEKKFNRAYRAILKLYNLKIENPEHPKFIDYACNLLKTPNDFAVLIHDMFTKTKKYHQPHFRVEGYILALIYLFGRQRFGFTLKFLDNKFHISSQTISNRKNELKKVIKKFQLKNVKTVDVK